MGQPATREGAMRKLSALIAIGCVVVVATAVPALADKPSTQTFEAVVEEFNPCTEAVHQMTFTVHVKEHEVGNQLVLVTSYTVATDDGFIGQGHETAVERGAFVSASFNDKMTNAETHQKIATKGRFLLKDGEVKLESFEKRCVRS